VSRLVTGIDVLISIMARIGKNGAPREAMEPIRTATEADAAAIADIYAHYVRETAISFEEIPPGVAEMARRMAAILETYPFLVFRDGERVLGYIYGSVHRARPAYRWSVETTVYTAPQAHGRGIGRALYTRLLEILTRQGFHSAVAGITLPNDKSVGLHRAMGFVPIGTFPEVGFKAGAWHDVSWWRRTLADGLPAGDPVPFPQLRL
jgi:phosphinothricin acetyltransferase